MMMKESENYDRILNMLKKSRPVPDSEEYINREVMSRIIQSTESRISLSDIIDFLFGWVYIGWVRKILVTASVILVMIFVYQQGVILKQINYLSNQVVINNGYPASDPSDVIGKILMMYRISGRRFSSGDLILSEKQSQQLLDKVNELQVKYEDLLNLFEEDPELRKYIEQKLIENNLTKIKL
jgi:hypothetical protein